MAGASQTAASVDIFMIALVPQTEQRHRSANGLAALARNHSWSPGALPWHSWILPARRICRIIAIPFSILTCKVCLSPTMSVRGRERPPRRQESLRAHGPAQARVPPGLPAEQLRRTASRRSGGSALLVTRLSAACLSRGSRFRYPVMCSLRTPPAHPTDRTMRASA